MIVMLIISEKSWMFLTIGVYDSYVDNFWEELNVLDDLCMIIMLITSEKRWMILAICVYDGSIDNIREKLNGLDDLCKWWFYWKYQKRSQCAWRFLHMIVLLIISENIWRIFMICVYDDYIDNIIKEVNVLDDLCLW
jgi:hypothetical protein